MSALKERFKMSEQEMKEWREGKKEPMSVGLQVFLALVAFFIGLPLLVLVAFGMCAVFVASTGP